MEKSFLSAVKPLVVTATLWAAVSGCTHTPHNHMQPDQGADIFAFKQPPETRGTPELRRLEAAVATHPGDPEALFNLASGYARDAEQNSSPASQDLALLYFNKVLELAPGNASTLQAMYNIQYRKVLRLGEDALPQARALYEQFSPGIRRDTNPPSLALFIYHYLDQAKRDHKDYPLLQNYLLSAIKEQPYSDASYIQLARLYRTQGYHPLALAVLKQAEQYNDPSQDLYRSIAETYSARAEAGGCNYEHPGYLQDATAYYKRAIPLAAEVPDLHYALAQIYLDQNQTQLALNEAQIMLELDPSAENLAFLAQQYSLRGEHALAKEFLARALTKGLTADDSTIHETFINAGDWAAATDAFIAYMHERKEVRIYDLIKADILSRQVKRDLSGAFKNKSLRIDTEWEQRMAQFWMNKIPRAELEQAADNRCKRTEVFFYGGYRHLLDGDTASARQDFNAALAQNTYRFVERPLARYFYDRLSGKEMSHP